MEYYSNLNALPHDPVFRVEFVCKNCGKEFTREFDANADVHPAGAGMRDFIGIDEVNGNLYKVDIDNNQYRLQCDNCDVNSSLYVTNREPLGDC